MKWGLVLVILLMGGGGYFEYQNLQDELTSDQKQIGDLKSKLQDATNDDQKAEDSLAQLKKSVADEQAKADSLASQLQAAKAAAQAAAAAATPSTASSSSDSSSTPTTASTPALPLITKLGTIATLDGKTYSNCQLLKVRPDDIVISDTDGITQVNYNILPAAMQKLFGYDPKLGALSDTQVDSLEQQREAAAAAGK